MTEILEYEIIAFYLLPSSATETSKYFSLDNHNRTLYKILEKYNINKHSKDTINKLRQKAVEKTNLEKYGNKSTLALDETKIKSNLTRLKNNELPYDTKLKIIAEYTKPNNLTAVAKKFHIGIIKVRKILAEFNIAEHNYETIKACTLVNSKKTCIEKYNVEFTFQSANNITKSRATKLKKYNNINYNNIEKAKKTCLQHYGVDNYFKTDEASAKRLLSNTKPAYIYNNENFDSFPELAFYKYYVDHNLNIKRNTEYFEYLFAGNIHKYYPDFVLDGLYYEIKGNHFLTTDGSWQNPFDHSLDAISEAKHQCALQNNVKILYKKDYKIYTDWFYKQGYKKEDFIPDKINNKK